MKFTKITKVRAENTNLGVSGLDLHFNSPERVNFFGAQSSLGGAQFLFGGARPRNAPPWRRAWEGAYNIFCIGGLDVAHVAYI